MFSCTIGKHSISIFLDGEFFSVDDTHANHPFLMEELRKLPADRDMEVIRSFITVRKLIETLSYGRITITGDVISFDGAPVSNYMTTRMLDIINQGVDIAPWALFMDKLFDNPATYARDELYQWMEKARMPICPDGDFLAFKKVRADYTDCYTGLFDNSVGNVLEMDRAACDPDRDNHCSSGFHFCSPGYLRNFPGERVMVVKINPRDITSIPSDYKFTKGRTCRYEVIAELSYESAAHHGAWSRRGVIDLENPAEFPKDVVRQIIKRPPPIVTVLPASASDPVDPDGDTSVALTPPASPPAVVTTTVKLRKSPRAACVSSTMVRTFAKPAAPTPVTSQSFHAGGRLFLPATIQKAVAGNVSIRAAARELGVGESTLRGWAKRL